MRTLTLSFVLCLMLSAISCSTVTVDYNYAPETNFASLKSYSWFPVPRQNVRHDLLVKKIKSEMKRQLHVRDFKMVTDNPDFLIALHGGFQSRLDYLDWQYLYEQYQTYWAKRRADIAIYEDNQLIVDFIDATSKELIYRATATAFIMEATPEKRETIINDAITKILVNFPPITISER